MKRESTELARESSTLVELLRLRATVQADLVAFTFLHDDGNEISLTYRELDQHAQRIATLLQQRATPGERALLLYPPGLDFITAFFGCLYAGIVAVPTYPPHSLQKNRALSKIQAILSDAQPSLVLTTTSLFPVVAKLHLHLVDFQRLILLDTTQNIGALSLIWQQPVLSRETLALLQYTSGSTATPKGVMVSHGNLLHNQSLMQSAFSSNEPSILVGWLPLYHDMGLIGNVLQPLYRGKPCALMSPVAFLQRPVRWLQLISRYPSVASGGPNFAYDLCVDRIPPEQRNTLNLSGWCFAFSGAEPIRFQTLERFTQAFACAGFDQKAFYPVYGLAETTLFVSGYAKNSRSIMRRFDRERLKLGVAHAVVPETERSQSLVSCGQPPGDQQVVIVHPATGNRCQPGEIGEIWVSGPSVAQGYWMRPQETERVFRARLADQEAPFLRTGDLGFLYDGDLFITGRQKDLIIIRGRNYYPQDIEATVAQSHPTLQPNSGVAFSVDPDGAGGERLVIVQEVKRSEWRELNTVEIIQAIRRQVAQQHEIQVQSIVLINPASLPKTSSGKLQRSLCRERFLEGTLSVLAEWEQGEQVDPSLPNDSSPVSFLQTRESFEDWLVTTLATRLGISPSLIDVTRPIITYGLDSLTSAELLQEGEQKSGIQLPLSKLLDGSSITEIADLMYQQALALSSSSTTTEHLIIEAKDHAQQLSFAQEGLWLLTQFNRPSVIPFALHIHGALNQQAFERTLSEILRRHTILRTGYTLLGEQPTSFLEHSWTVNLPEIDLCNLPAQTQQAEIHHLLQERLKRPFRLDRPPLIYFSLFKLNSQDYQLFLLIHHIAADAWSLNVFSKELTTLYEAFVGGYPSPLPDLAFQYQDYALWQRAYVTGETLDKLAAYWKKQLAGIPPVLELPGDRSPSSEHRFTGAVAPLKVPATISQALKALSRHEQTTLFMTLLASLQFLFHYYSGQEDILIGTSVANRQRPGTEALIGCFMNILPLRAKISDAMSFRELLAQVRQVALAAYQHQEMPFELLVALQNPLRLPSYNPLIRVIFIVHQDYPQAMTCSDILLRPEPIALPVTEYDFLIRVWDSPEALNGWIEYNAELFTQAAIERLIQHFQQLLITITANPDQCFRELSLLSEAEQHQQVVAWNATRRSFDDSCLYELFERRVRQHPENPALFSGQQQITYKDLECRVDQLARHLLELEIGPEVVVGIFMERSIEFVVGILAILKAGGAYLPLDPDYPAERLAFMLEDSRVPLLLTRQDLLPRLPHVRARPVCLDSDWSTIEPLRSFSKHAPIEPENLAYLIYTSGSTGIPKGIAIRQRGIVNNLLDLNRRFAVGETDRVLALSSLSFDMCVYEVLGTLVAGGAIVIPEPELARDPAHWAELLIRHQISIWNSAPKLLEMFVEYIGNRPQFYPRSLRLVLLGGDWVPITLPQRLKALVGDLTFIVLGGATEASIHSTIYQVETPGSAWRSIPYGRPMANQQVYILSKHLQLVPAGEAGELYLGGKGLARGYAYRPDLTAERFIPHPFSQTPGERLYRTGDLVRFLPDGTLELLGRLDHQVKIRGFRIELGEIEAVLREHPGVQDAVVVMRESQEGEKHLVSYIIQKQDWQAEHLEISQTQSGKAAQTLPIQIQHWLRDRLPAYMIPASLTIVDYLPLTANGKVDRQALPAPRSERPELEEMYIAPYTPVEISLAEIWKHLLGIELIGIHDSFFALGGHSLLAMQIISRINETFEVEVPLRALFETPTIAGLAKKIDMLCQNAELDAHQMALVTQSGKEIANQQHIVPRGNVNRLPMSFAQRRLWFQASLAPAHPFYNIDFALRFTGVLHLSALQRSLDYLVERHETLRTTFTDSGGELLQIINPAWPQFCSIIDLCLLPADTRTQIARDLAKEAAHQPFDLVSGPLLRAKVVKLREQEYMFLLSMHHIITDGWSIGIFAREFALLYTAYSAGEQISLPPLTIQYADYARWQQQWLRDEFLQNQYTYWIQQLQGLSPLLHLRTDRSRPPVQTFRGSRYSFSLPADLKNDIQTFSQSEGMTLFMVLLTAFAVVIKSLTPQQEFIITTDVANRYPVQTETLIGFFVNQLPFRISMVGDPTFAELVTRCREVTLGAYAHQHLPFEMIVEALNPERTLSYSPFSQVKLVLQNTPGFGLALPGLQANVTTSEKATAQCDLLLNMFEAGESLEGYMEYNTDLFNESTIQGMVADFECVLRSALRAPGLRTGELQQILEETERQRKKTQQEILRNYRSQTLRVKKRSTLDGKKETYE